MHKILPIVFISIFFFISNSVIQAQGCSDAGACSVPALKPSIGQQEVAKNKFRLGANVGSADHAILAGGAMVGYSRQFGDRFSADVQLTYATRSGNDISVSGIGDLFALLNYKVSSTITVTGGTKLNLHEANETFEGRMLPMDYQPSLGTPDLLFGITYQNTKWLLALGYQQPVDQNQNLFLPSEWPADSPLSEFTQTGRYSREGDLLLRITRIVPINERFALMPGLLPIYHIGNDADYYTYEKDPIEGSSGLTLNATLLAELKFGKSNTLSFNIGFPLIVREVRPDGLTRSVVAGIEYGVTF